MNILLIDDHPLFLGGISATLEKLGPGTTVATSGSCEEALEIIANDASFDLVLLDLNLPGMDGVEGIGELRKLLPSTPVAMLSATEERSKILQAIEAGAQGFIPKSASGDVILGAVQLLLSGGNYLPMAILDEFDSKTEKTATNQEYRLTPRQQDVLKLLSAGQPNKVIARSLGLSENTVRIHVSAILKALDVSNRTEAGAVAAKLGLLGDD